MLKKLLAPVLVIAMLALPACGSSEKTSPALNHVPGSAKGVISFKSPYAWGEAEKDQAYALIKVAGAQKGDKTFDQYLDRVMNQGEENDGIEFDKDIKPWLGSSISIAMVESDLSTKNAAATSPTTTMEMPTDMSMPEGAESPDSPIGGDMELGDELTSRIGSDASKRSVEGGPSVAIIESKNDAKAKEYVAKEEKKTDNKQVFLVKDKFLYMTNLSGWCDDCTDSAVKEKASAKLNEFANLKPADSIMNNATFKELSKKTSTNKDMLAYFEEDPQSADGLSKGLVSGQLLGSTKKLNVMMSGDLQGKAARMEMVMKGLDAKLTGSASIPELLNGLPADTNVAIEVRGVGDAIKNAVLLGQMAGAEQTNALVEMFKNFKINPTTDLNWMNGEAVVSIGDFTARDFGLVVKVSDEKAAKDFVDKVSAVYRIMNQGFVEVSPGVYSFAASPIAPDVTIGVTNGRFIFGGRKPYFDQLAKPSDKPLSATEGYKKFISPKEKTLTAFYMQPDEIANKFATLIPDAKTRDMLKQMDSIGMQVRPEGEFIFASGVMSFTNAK